MRISPSLIALLSAVWIGHTNAQSTDDDSTLRKNYTNLNGVSIMAVHDHLYIDGGGVYHKLRNGSFDWRAMNHTLVVPLASSWDKKDIEVEPLDKGGFRNYMREALWFDEKESKIYAWGGYKRQEATSESINRQLWSLKTSTSGPEKWEIQRPSNAAFFDGLIRLKEGLYTTCNGVGYYLNGFTNSWTDSRIADDSIVVPGMLTYDFETTTWTNETSDSALGYITYSGTANCLPDYGSKGLILYMGGIKGQQGDFTAWDFVHFSNVTLYDVETKEWYWQETTGDIPFSRKTFCSVGVPGPNGTYEIYIYGGYADDTDYGDVAVLSLPAFRWFKGNDDGIPVKNAACALVGNSQMITIGGRDKTITREADTADFKDTVFIMDLPTMTWKDNYDADAPKYDSPEVIKEWYDKGGIAKWSNERVQNLFEPQVRNKTDPTPEPTPDPEPEKKSTNVGAIAGGTVGGVAFIAALVAILFFVRRSRRRKAGSQDEFQQQNQNGLTYHSELPGSTPAPYVEEYYKPVPQHDLSPTTEMYSELGGDHPMNPREVHEMEAPQTTTIPRKPVQSPTIPQA